MTCNKVQGQTGAAQPEATDAVSVPAQVAKEPSAACAAGKVEAESAPAHWEKVPDPPQHVSGESRAEFWRRQFAHVRNKGRQQIQVRIFQFL
jgi:hypothetical protein